MLGEGIALLVEAPELLGTTKQRCDVDVNKCDDDVRNFYDAISAQLYDPETNDPLSTPPLDQIKIEFYDVMTRRFVELSNLEQLRDRMRLRLSLRRAETSTARRGSAVEEDVDPSAAGRNPTVTPVTVNRTIGLGQDAENFIWELTGLVVAQLSSFAYDDVPVSTLYLDNLVNAVQKRNPGVSMIQPANAGALERCKTALITGYNTGKDSQRVHPLEGEVKRLTEANASLQATVDEQRARLNELESGSTGKAAVVVETSEEAPIITGGTLGSSTNTPKRGPGNAGPNIVTMDSGLLSPQNTMIAGTPMTPNMPPQPPPSPAIGGSAFNRPMTPMSGQTPLLQSLEDPEMSRDALMTPPNTPQMLPKSGAYVTMSPPPTPMMLGGQTQGNAYVPVDSVAPNAAEPVQSPTKVPTAYTNAMNSTGPGAPKNKLDSPTSRSSSRAATPLSPHRKNTAPGLDATQTPDRQVISNGAVGASDKPDLLPPMNHNDPAAYANPMESPTKSFMVNIFYNVYDPVRRLTTKRGRAVVLRGGRVPYLTQLQNAACSSFNRPALDLGYTHTDGQTRVLIRTHDALEAHLLNCKGRIVLQCFDLEEEELAAASQERARSTSPSNRNSEPNIAPSPPALRSEVPSRPASAMAGGVPSRPASAMSRPASAMSRPASAMSRGGATSRTHVAFGAHTRPASAMSVVSTSAVSVPIDSGSGTVLDDEQLEALFYNVSEDGATAPKETVLAYLQDKYDDMGDPKRFSRLLQKFRGPTLTADEFAIVLLKLSAS